MNPTKTLIDPDINVPLPLKIKRKISNDTILFTFELPSSDHILGHTAGQHIYLSCTIDGKFIEEAYTPVQTTNTKGYVDLIIQIISYDDKYPENGIMTRYLENLQIGNCVDFRGPCGLLKYNGNGVFEIKANEGSEPVTRNLKTINMVAGNVGIALMLQLTREVLNDPNDNTSLKLLYENKSEQDILVREELESYRDKYPSRFSLWYTVEHAEGNWHYSKGCINEDMVKGMLAAPADDTMVFVCCPPTNDCIRVLKNCGFNDDQLFIYY